MRADLDRRRPEFARRGGLDRARAGAHGDLLTGKLGDRARFLPGDRAPAAPCLAHRAGAPARRHAERHARLPDARRPALHPAAGRRSCWPRTPPAAAIPGGWSTTSRGGASMSCWRPDAAGAVQGRRIGRRGKRMSDSNDVMTADVVLVGRRHHEHDARGVPEGAAAPSQDRDHRAPARRGAGKLGRLEQRRHRPCRQLRAELHADARPTAASTSRARSRSMSSSTCRGSSGRT